MELFQTCLPLTLVPSPGMRNRMELETKYRISLVYGLARLITRTRWQVSHTHILTYFFTAMWDASRDGISLVFQAIKDQAHPLICGTTSVLIKNKNIIFGRHRQIKASIGHHGKPEVRNLPEATDQQWVESGTKVSRATNVNFTLGCFLHTLKHLSLTSIQASERHYQRSRTHSSQAGCKAGPVRGVA